jgi:PAS domain S-box-containing protein
VVVANDTHITEANEIILQLLGRSRAELQEGGIPWREITPPEWRRADDQGVAELLKFGACTPYEKEWLRNDGSRVPVLVGASVLEPSPLTWVGFVLDLTERKKMTEALTQAQQGLRQHAQLLQQEVEDRTAKLQEAVADLEHFSYTVSHDMRAPLRGILGFSELMMDAGCARCGNSVSKGFLQRVVSGAHRMNALITDAVKYNRAARDQLRLTRVDVGSLLREMLDSHPNLHSSYADITLDGTVPPVLGDQTALTQCLANLLSNAIKFVAPGVKPCIRIWAERRAAGKVRCWVGDNGIGIPKEAQSKMFEMFQRLSNTYEDWRRLALVRKA